MGNTSLGQMNVGINFDSSSFEQGLKNLQKNMNVLDSQMRVAQSSIANFGNSTDSLKSKADSLSQKIELQKQKVQSLQEAYNESVRTKGADATATQNLEIRLNNATTSLNKMQAELKETKQELSTMPNSFDKINQAMENTNTKMASYSKNIVSFGKTITATITTAVAAFGGSTLKAGMDFESAMSNVKAVSAATSDQMVQLQALAIKMGKDTKYSATESAQGMEELLKAGVSITDVLNGGLQGALNLASAGEIDLADAAEIASTVLNAFKNDNLSVANAADILAGAANASATDVGDLKYSLSMVSAVASGVGLKFKDTSTALALFAQHGLKGSDAGTSLKTMLLNLQPTSDKQVGIFKQLGIMTKDNTNLFYDQSGNIKNLSDISQILQDKMKNLTAQQRSLYLEQMFGTDATRAANILFQEGTQGFADMSSEMSKTTALDVATTKMDNLAGSMELFKGSIETIQTSLYTLYQGDFKKIVDQATNVVNKFLELDQASQRQVVSFLGMAAAIGPSIVAFGQIVPIIAPLGGNILKLGSNVDDLSKKGIEKLKIFGSNSIDTFNKAGNAVKDFASKDNIFSKMVSGIGEKSSIITSKIKEIAFMKIPDVEIKIPFIDNMISKVQGLLPAVGGAFGQIGTVAQGAIGKLQSIAGLALQFVGPVALIGIVLAGLGMVQGQFGTQIDQFVQTAITKGPTIIQGLINGIVSKLPDLINNGTTLLISFLNVITANLPTIINGGVQLLTGLIDGVVNNLDKIIPAVLDVINILLVSLVNNLPLILDAGLKILMALVDGIVNNIDKIINGIINVMMALINKIPEFLPQLIEAGIKILVALIQGLSKALPQLISYLPQIISSIWNAFGKVDWMDIGKNIINGLVDGLKALGHLVWDTLKSIGTDALDSFKNLFGIHSPSRVFAQFGNFMMQGLSNGLDDNSDNVSNSLNNIRKLADNAFNGNYSYSFDGVNTNLNDISPASIGKNSNVYNTNNNSNSNSNSVNIVFNVQQMDQENLDTCYKYFQKKLGEAYS